MVNVAHTGHKFNCGTTILTVVDAVGCDCHLKRSRFQCKDDCGPIIDCDDAKNVRMMEESLHCPEIEITVFQMSFNFLDQNNSIIE